MTTPTLSEKHFEALERVLGMRMPTEIRAGLEELPAILRALVAENERLTIARDSWYRHQQAAFLNLMRAEGFLHRQPDLYNEYAQGPEYTSKSAEIIQSAGTATPPQSPSWPPTLTPTTKTLQEVASETCDEIVDEVIDAVRYVFTPDDLLVFVEALRESGHVQAPPQAPAELIRFDFINADGREDSKVITHDEMRQRYEDINTAYYSLMGTPQAPAVGDDTIALMARLLRAVYASDHYGTATLDIEGHGNWFDVRDRVLKSIATTKEKAEKERSNA